MNRAQGLSIAVVLGLVGAGASSSCIIPDHGIVAWVDCGARWCAAASFAEALDEGSERIQVQQANPDGTVGWVTECQCMTPEQDLVLFNRAPAVQYDLLRTQVLNAARQRCLDVAIANGYDPDPPPPDDELLDPSCYEAVTEVYRDGCCAMRSDECGGITSCGPVDTGGPMDTGGSDDADTGQDSADDTTGEGVLSCLDDFYAHIECTGSTCTIGQPLIDAVLAHPEAALAEGTSLRFDPTDAPTGLRLEGVEPDGIADRLGLHEGDRILQLDDLPLTTEAQLLEAVTHAYDALQLSVLIERGGKTHRRHFVRVP